MRSCYIVLFYVCYNVLPLHFVHCIIICNVTHSCTCCLPNASPTLVRGPDCRFERDGARDQQESQKPCRGEKTIQVCEFALLINICVIPVHSLSHKFSLHRSLLKARIMQPCFVRVFPAHPLNPWQSGDVPNIGTDPPALMRSSKTVFWSASQPLR